ncbi:NAD-dependent succinate-semialdehyde dehydrogenase [Amphritea balenae]|uniref:NAD-dependent succinate-semialdehyde dehydrogenase n=1 Tax=Amphritea balenae TaxID=452629 RepID=A0A3P1SY90_9GAMM|nr:NAD-dependent succinate-semialdehyde dehydrogenase [Amphritea balenae]RRD01083.1 NAD-dependent succinate-semialdehyde dehydrogenase [Amphritea balenae]GGK60089.1 NAD-dependent succinate-semialdehyde dehydrogenase [Amphritea balenae]
MFINGEWIKADNSFAVYNPATGEEIAQVADGTRDDTRQAINAASAALPGWSALTNYQRSDYLRRAYELMIERKKALASLMTKEQGKPFKAAMAEVQYGADYLLWFAEEVKRTYGETIPSARPDQRFIVQQMPIGVVGAVTPWNYPVSMITRKVAPAIAAGCTIVLKPAEATPLSAIAIFEILEEAGIPAGVINLVTTKDPVPVGEELCTNPVVRKLTFTGSTAVGKKLAQDAAPQLKRVSMELGGHAPFIVFDDADPVHAAKGASLVKFLNTGQACISPNRIFVQRSILEPFLAEFENRVNRMKAGNGMEPGVNIGPLVNEAAINKVNNQVVDAVGKGAKLHTGGEVLRDDGLAQGNFYAPTLLSGVTEEMLIYREETFGPVAAVIPFDTQEEVLAMANDTNYGLAAYIYTQNLSRAMRVFEGLQFGMVGINDINPTSAAAPFGGMKESGLGREGAREGLMEYYETKLAGISI